MATEVKEFTESLRAVSKMTGKTTSAEKMPNAGRLGLGAEPQAFGQRPLQLVDSLSGDCRDGMELKLAALDVGVSILSFSGLAASILVATTTIGLPAKGCSPSLPKLASS